MSKLRNRRTTGLVALIGIVISGARAEAQANQGAPARPAAIDAQIGIRGFTRSLSYTDDIFGQLRPYDLAIGPAFGGALEIYPGAAVSTGAASYLGLVASFEQAFGISSRRTDGSLFPSASSSASVGARVRLPIGRHEVGAVVAWGTHRYTTGNAERARTSTSGDPGIPDVEYEFVRAGASLRLALADRVAVFASGAYLFVYTAGELTRAPYFPRASMGGIDATLGLAIDLGSGVELRASADIRRYFFALNPEPGDAFIAGGAVDQYIGGTLALAYRH